MRFKTRLATSIAAAVLVLSASGVANATYVTECLGKISTLRLNTDAVTTYTNSKDESGLLGKLDNSADKLNSGKNSDAIQKLMDFYNQVNSLETAAKPKIAFNDGETLKAGALDAKTCIENIGK